MTTSSTIDTEMIAATKAWLQNMVIGQNLCPFAKAVYIKEQIRYRVLLTNDTDVIADTLCDELALLAATPIEDTEATDATNTPETTLLIVNGALDNFDDYLDFLATADAIVDGLGYRGVLQLASFHPRYQFDGTAPEDISNFTNRSPYPLLHLLREESIDRAVAAYPDAEMIYQRNIETMKNLGAEGIAKIMKDCS